MKIVQYIKFFFQKRRRKIEHKLTIELLMVLVSFCFVFALIALILFIRN